MTFRTLRAPPLPGRAVPDLRAPDSSPPHRMRGAATPGAGYPEVPRKICPIDWREGTWHVKKLIRCAAARWSVPGRGLQGAWPSRTASPTSAPAPTTATAGPPASSSTCVGTGLAGPVRSDSGAGRRSTPAPTSWSPCAWCTEVAGAPGAALDPPRDRTARAGQPQHHAPHLVQRGGHHGGPGRVTVRHDPHPREPLPRRSRPDLRTDRTPPSRAGRSTSIWSNAPRRSVAPGVSSHSADTVALFNAISEPSSGATHSTFNARHITATASST